MDNTTKIALSLVLVSAILGFIPSNEGVLLIIKLLVFGGLGGFFYYVLSGSRLEKRIQVILKDVRSQRQSDYREELIKALSSLGQSVKLNEEPDEIAVAVDTKRSIEDVKKSIDKHKLRIQFNSVFASIRYTSLEAAAEMIVAISGSATPNSDIIIEGLSGKIRVDGSGEFLVKAPLSLIEKHRAKGYIPGKCKKGSLVEDIQILIPK